MAKKISSKRWSRVTEDLKSSSGRDFEQRVLPLLRVKWPSLVNPKALGLLDQRGIDHVLVGPGDPLEVVVQCKGFQIEEPLGDSQIAQVRKSVDSFLASPHRCATYLLVYNRHGQNRDFDARLDHEVTRLHASGKAGRALVWDLNRLVREIDERLAQRMLSEIERLGDTRRRDEQSRFTFGDVVLKRVPCQRGRLALRRFELPSFQMEGAVEVRDPLDDLAADRRGWTLVVGSFGAGKSTLSHRLSQTAGRRLLYVPAAALTHAELGTQSENELVCSIVAYLGLFNDWSEFDDSEKRLLVHLAGPILAARLRAQDTKFILLIDAIDENRFYSTMRGFQLLTNELSRASCRIVLTTRKEHFLDHFLSYAQPLGEGSSHAKGDVDLLELHHWTIDQARQYVDGAMARTTEPMSSQLRSLRSELEQGVMANLALQHPLLLAMLVDLVAHEGSNVLHTRADLYRRWARFKLARDFGVHRKTPLGFDNEDQLIWNLLELMADIAVAMTAHSGELHELTESIHETQVHQLAATRLGHQVPSDIYTTTSLLEPMRTREADGMVLHFFHRSFHEYFLAVALRRQNLSPDGYPAEVRLFCEELSRDGAPV
ncbi:hypothetical protein [Methylibium sp.]|uniref:hypothetical protein n=1 Tax=Methylibium sp. TaxID=2067992 RepID=UPI003D152962